MSEHFKKLNIKIILLAGLLNVTNQKYGGEHKLNFMINGKGLNQGPLKSIEIVKIIEWLFKKVIRE